MQALLKEVEIVEEDMLREGEITSRYGSVLNDMIMINWLAREDPASWLQKNPDILSRFNEIFDQYATEANIELYRGTDYVSLANLDVGDIIDCSDRYTSWTTDRSTAMVARPIVLIFRGTIKVFNFTMNKSEKEYIVPPQQFTILQKQKLNEIEFTVEISPSATSFARSPDKVGRRQSRTSSKENSR